jgi:hypothetical protein
LARDEPNVTDPTQRRRQFMARTWKGAQAAALALSLCSGSVVTQANIVVNGSVE